MASVTQIAGRTRQPLKGYVPLSQFSKMQYFDDRVVVGEHNIRPALLGLAVDYGSRLMQGSKSREVFAAALHRAAQLGASEEAEEQLSRLSARYDATKGIDPEGIALICDLAGFELLALAGDGSCKPRSVTRPNDQTLADISVLIARTVEFFSENGPVVESGPSFSGGRSPKVEGGCADYLTKDTLWDLRVSKTDPDKKSTLQILLCYLLALHSGRQEYKGITKAGIYNPFLQCAWTVSVSSLDAEVLRTLESEVLDLNGRHASQPKLGDSPSSTIYHVIDWIRDTSESEAEKGERFERATRYFLKNDPVYSQRFKEVWRWQEAPTNDGRDLGIDLVALDAQDGRYWAIQCKCYQKSALDYGDVATFYSKIGAAKVYKHNMIVTTCENFGPNLDSIAGQWQTVRLFADGMAQSEVDWDAFMEGRKSSERVFKEALPHQREAIDACKAGFSGGADRGQLIMACGTGKTITSLRLAEELLPGGAVVLFLAPSIALVAQTMREWANQSKRPLRCAVVCSDATASETEGDTWETSLFDVPYPATTNAHDLVEQLGRFDRLSGLNVVFSTYQSIQVVCDAQKRGLGPFDLVVCDEAHRTAGAAVASDNLKEQNEFTKVHDNRLLSAIKRLYMTATPKLYGDRARQQAKTESYEISSMDDEAKFGPVFYRLTFGRAVNEGLLTDYRVVALTVSAEIVSEVYQMAMAGKDGFEITDAAKVIGCWKGLADQGKGAAGVRLKNAVAFCSTIPESRRMAEYFQQTVSAYLEYEREQGNRVPMLECAVDHVDGTMDMAERKKKLAWLANEGGDAEDGGDCHVLSNVRCLAEGVDVPNLDAIMFLQPKKSRIEVVQAVGRVMRRFEGKEYGYIILPVVVPLGMTPEEALDNTDAFKVVWEIVQALRSHDERLDGAVNGLAYDPATTAVVEVINVTKDDAGQALAEDEGRTEEKAAESQLKLDLPDKQLQEAVNAVLVKKCGTKVYWEDWARDIGEIAQRHIDRVRELTLEKGPAAGAFESFLKGLRKSLNKGITRSEAVEMIAQHMITLPVFEALFAGATFASSNPVSVAMENMVEALRTHGIESDSERRELAELYSSVRLRAEGVRTDGGRQKIIKELYEKFFSRAFKATSEKMGIVYTPNEVVNYILHATDRLLQKEFDQRLSDKGVNILDPFTGTGTFIVNLLQAEDLMPAEKLVQKYKHEIWCNEILLLAYYIATINIEHAYHSRVPGEYVPFEGAVLTDTFQMHEEDDTLDTETFVENSDRILLEIDAHINVIVGNPPYSAGQRSANDNNANQSYPTLDAKIADTYVRRTGATNKNSVYDMYIRAFRWASDRIGERGIVSFVTNGGWLDGTAMEGFRKCLVDEFSSIYVLNLRGNQRTQGERSRKEGGKIFGAGSRAPIAITILVKNPASEEHGAIHYHDIGDYLTRDEKLGIVRSSIKNEPFEWDTIKPDRHGDWLSQRDESWYDFAPLGIEKYKAPHGIFVTWSNGNKTQRDPWAVNYSYAGLGVNMEKMIDNYNAECGRLKGEGDPDANIDTDATRISWTRRLQDYVKKEKKIAYKPDERTLCQYRPFCKAWMYYDLELNEMTYQQPRLFPIAGGEGKKVEMTYQQASTSSLTEKGGVEMTYQQHSSPLPNIALCLTPGLAFSVLVTNILPDLHFVGDSQCFPLYWYEKKTGMGGGGFSLKALTGTSATMPSPMRRSRSFALRILAHSTRALHARREPRRTAASS